MRQQGIPSPARKPPVRLRLWPYSRHGGPYQAAPWRHAPVLGPHQLATNGQITVPFKSQAISGKCPMRPKKKTTSQMVRRSETPEDALWRNVILQAIGDATLSLPAGFYASRQMAKVREQAREWVAKQGEDFHTVCSLAGLEASRVHTFAMERIRKAIQADHDRIATENFLKGSVPGGVTENLDGERDRLTQPPQDSAKTDFPQNRNLTPCP